MSTPFARTPVPMTSEQTMDELIALLERNIETLTEARKTATHSDWVVFGADSRLPITYDLDDQGKPVGARPCKLVEARRAGGDATHAAAARIVDGHGKHARAVLLIDAIGTELADTRSLLAKARAWKEAADNPRV